MDPICGTWILNIVDLRQLIFLLFRPGAARQKSAALENSFHNVNCYYFAIVQVTECAASKAHNTKPKKKKKNSEKHEAMYAFPRI